jgi:hypothetical protein
MTWHLYNCLRYGSRATVPVSCASTPESSYPEGRKSGDTFHIGDTNVICSATDSAGNSGSGSFTNKVQYAFGEGTEGSSGFSSPISSSLSTFNEVKAGGVVPVKFNLGGEFGTNIFAPGYQISKQISSSTCAEAPTNPIDLPTDSTSGLKYDADPGQ